MCATLYNLSFAREEREYEGFALPLDIPSPIGSENLIEDLLPDCRRTGVPTEVLRLADVWVPPRVRGKVSPLHDSPGINLCYPAFSQRACDTLHEYLAPNGELLPLVTDIGAYYFYNITTYLEAFDRARSVFTPLKSDPLRVVDIEIYAFIESVVESADVFRTFDMPTDMIVSQRFVDRVHSAGLRGFSMTKMWPHPSGVKWRLTDDILT
jgi:hypothetical protein